MDAKKMPIGNSVSRREKFARWTTLVLGLVVAAIGCNPGSLYFLIPWEDKIEPKMTLAKGKKGSTVVVLASFANPATAFQPEYQTVEDELANKFNQVLAKRFEHNREKVKIVPWHQVKSFVNKSGETNLMDKREIGKKFKADYVINLEINSMSFYEDRNHFIFRGRSEIAVTVFAAGDQPGVPPEFNEIFRTEYPASTYIDATNSSVLQFRTLFINHIAKDLSKWFAAYPTQEKYDMD